MIEVAHIVRELEAKRAGAQWLALCPVHADTTPSLALRVGAEGRLLVRCHAGCEQGAIIDELKRRGLWADSVRDDGRNSGALCEVERISKAVTMWRAARSAKGTLVETYLRARAITLDPPPTLRFIQDAYHAESGSVFPALIAAVTAWPNNSVMAVQRIFLRYDGKGKAPFAPAKKSLGPLRGGAVRLAKVGHRLGIAEGIEDALSMMQMDPSLPCWATLGTANFETVVLPPLPLAAEVTIIADNDAAGRRAANEAGARFKRDGRVVHIAMPPVGFKDFNEALQKARGVP